MFTLIRIWTAHKDGSAWACVFNHATGQAELWTAIRWQYHGG